MAILGNYNKIKCVDFALNDYFFKISWCENNTV